MRGVRCKAPAKINLALHVTGKRGDGYHTLDTLAAFCTFGDTVTVAAAQSHLDQLQILGPFSEGLSAGADNLALRAASALRKACVERPCPPVSISVEKNIPAGAGLGGGSADAAAVLLALKLFWGLGDEIGLPAIAAGLGADVPMCLVSAPLRARGIGEHIKAATLTGNWPAVVVFPKSDLPTPSVFAALDSPANAGIEIADGGTILVEALGGMRNDLENPARKLCPEITDVITWLANAPNARLARMSGSGSACYALFESNDAAKKAADAIAQEKPGWWCMPTQIMAAAPPDRVTLIGG